MHFSTHLLLGLLLTEFQVLSRHGRRKINSIETVIEMHTPQLRGAVIVVIMFSYH